MKKFLILTLFIIYLILCFWGTNVKELQGDEASSILAILPALKLYQGYQGIGSIFLFGHAPIRALVEIPFILIFGLKEFWLYLPNVLATIFIFFVLKKILQKANKNSVLIGLSLLTLNGVIVISRMVMGVGFYILFYLLFLYFLYEFFKTFKKDNFKRSLIFLFLSILTYEEAVLFIPPLLIWLFKKKLLSEGYIKKNLLFFLIFLTLFLLSWIAGPAIALKLSLVNNLEEYGFFRIINRGSKLSLPQIDNIFKSFTLYNSPLYFYLLVSGLIFSFFEKKSYFFWTFLIFPLVYFLIVQNPTNHPSHYFALLIIVSSFGFIKAMSKFKNQKIFQYTLLLILASTLLHNFFYLKEKFYTLNSCVNCSGWGRLNHVGLKLAAYKIQEETPVCDTFYTDIEGHVFRLYFGRKTTDFPNNSKRQFLIKELPLSIDKKFEKKFDKNYSRFQKLLPYFECIKFN